MLLRKILLVFVAYLFIKFIYGIFKFRRTVKSAMREMQERQRDSQRTPPDGSVHIKGSRPTNSTGNKHDEGTYVDYEEVE